MSIWNILVSKSKEQETCKILGKNALANLKTVMDKGTRVAIFQDEQCIGQTMVLEVKKDYLLLETYELHPDYDRQLVIKNAEPNLPWEIHIEAVKKIFEKDSSYLKCFYADAVDINNRRDNYRIHLPGNNHYALEINLNGVNITAPMTDISCTGAQISLSPVHAASVLSDGELDHASLILKDIVNLPEISLTVKWNKQDENLVQIGIEFMEMTTENMDLMRKSLCSLERELLKHRAC